MNKLTHLLELLQLNQENGLYFHEDKQDLEFLNHNTKRSLDIISPTAFFCFDNAPLILFFQNLNSNDEKNIHQKIWNFNQSAVVFIINDKEINIYNGLALNKKTELLEQLADQKNIEDFSFWNIVSGKVWEKYKNKYNAKKQVDNYLLSNISEAIERLTIGSNALSREIANKLVARLIFTRYLIDRKVKTDSMFIKENQERKSLLDLIKNKDNLYGFFFYLKERFNGDFFGNIEQDKNIVQQSHLDILHRLFTEHLKTSQMVLFDVYDFSIIPIELISNIYERFIGEEKQNQNKSFYTPLFLVNYILSKTVDVHLKNKATCKILDPSCGSGIFLIESLRRIIERNKRQKDLTDDDLKQLVAENIYGVDKDENAITIAIFSIYITLLDYKNPREIENFKFPMLKNNNLFAANFFDDDISKLKNKKFSFILGNPPWGSVKTDQQHLDYIKKNKNLISDYQIAQSFLLRSQDFINEDAKCAMIVSSKILYNLNANKFRQFFLEKFQLNQILELSPVRKQIFNKAIGPAAILFYQKATKNSTFDNKVEHISLKPNCFFKLFKLIVIEKYDYKAIKQYYFKQYDWLFKVMVYGNILDFYFVKKLKDNFITLQDVVNNNSLTVGQGLIIGGGDSYDATKLNGKLFLDTNQKMLQKFYIGVDNNLIFNLKNVHRIRNPKIFCAPNVLLKRGLDPSLNSYTAYNDKDLVFTNSVTAIKGEKKQGLILKSITGILNSSLFQYFILNTGASTGVEREEAYNKEKFKLPIKLDNKISNLVDEIQKLNIEKASNIFKQQKYENNISQKEEALNNLIFDLYKFNSQERDLIDYALKISIPLFQNKSEPFEQLNDSDFNKYAEVFLNHFSQRFNGPNEYFKIDVYPKLNNYFSAMHFKVEKSKPQENINIVDSGNNKDLFDIFSKLSIDKIYDDLFIQKDVKGFEKDSFYVIKPNEYKNWHPAVARLDLAEFMDAIFDAEINKQGNYSSCGN